MTLEELEKTLPNGLHDAEVKLVAVDYELRTRVMELVVWVGDMNDAPERITYRTSHKPIANGQKPVL